MQIHDVEQGTQEWLELRAKFHTASEAPAMMGASTKVSRTELLAMKAIGSEKEHSDWVKRNLFDKGHEYEAMARPLAEEIVGDELYPVVGSRDNLLASFDGITMFAEEPAIFEHKMWNQTLAAHVRAGELPEEYYWQVEQQLYVSGAKRCLFVVSDGTKENFVHMWYEPVEGRIERLIAGWKQFDEDLANYKPEPQVVEAVGRAPENLPALHIEVTGQVVASNLGAYKEHALAVIQSINRDLVTDQDFADAEQTIKWLKDVEDKLAAAKEHALSQTQSIDQLFKAIDDISAEARATRLELNRSVNAQKENLRNKIREKAQADFDAHIERINKRLGDIRLPEIKCDIAGAMRGKRTLVTLQDAADTAVAQAKLDANEVAELIEENLRIIAEVGKGFEFLFADKQQLVVQGADAVKALVEARITKHNAEQQAKKEAEQKAREKAEQQAKEETQPQAEAPIAPRVEHAKIEQPAEKEPATLTVGAINERLSPITLTAQGIAELGIEPAEVKGNARRYTEGNFIQICMALISHINEAAKCKEAA